MEIRISNKIKRRLENKWVRRLLILSGIVLALSVPMRCKGPYKGRIVDNVTGKPIQGAVAIANWTTVTINAAGGTTRCLDAREAVSDENGEFMLKGRSAPFFGLFPGNMRIYIYKVGYRKVTCEWSEFDPAGSCYLAEPVAFDGDRAVFALTRVAPGQLGYEGRPPTGGCGRKDGKPLSAYTKEVEKWEREMGIIK